MRASGVLVGVSGCMASTFFSGVLFTDLLAFFVLDHYVQRITDTSIM